MAYQVVLAPAAEKTISKLPKPTRQRIADRLAALAADPRPHGSIKLAGEESYRLRVGDYRVIYSILTILGSRKLSLLVAAPMLLSHP